MKSLYIVDYWVPFPSSEYGGVINLIAENDTEAFTILSDEQTYDDEYNHLIMQNVVSAQKFVLQDDYESGIIDSFTTWIIMAKGFNVKEEKRYTLEVEETSGWYVVVENVSQEDCRSKYEEQLNQGVNPQRLRITRIAWWLPTQTSKRIQICNVTI